MAGPSSSFLFYLLLSSSQRLTCLDRDLAPLSRFPSGSISGRRGSSKALGRERIAPEGSPTTYTETSQQKWVFTLTWSPVRATYKNVLITETEIEFKTKKMGHWGSLKWPKTIIQYTWVWMKVPTFEDTSFFTCHPETSENKELDSRTG